MRNARALLALVLAALAVWAAVSVADLQPLRKAVRPEDVSGPLGAVAAVGVLFYAFAAAAYFRVYRRRGRRLALAEPMVAHVPRSLP